MPIFYFHLRTAEGLEPDELGAEFKDLDAAYLDACRAVVDMSAEMLRERKDPNGLAFEIRDERGGLLMEMPFRELLRPAERLSPPTRAREVRETLHAQLAVSRELRADVRASVADARTTLQQAQRIMRRTRGDPA